MNEHAPSFQRPFDDALNALGTDPIPAGVYYDPDWYKLEVEAIFRRSWLNVGHVCELPEPGSFFRCELEFAKASLIVARGRDGAIRAFHNACTHRGTQLVDRPRGKAATFSCPYHMWTFGNDGQLLSAPDFERFYIDDKASCNLAEAGVDVCAGLIFVNLDRAPRQGLREFLGPMGEMIETLPVSRASAWDEYVYEIDANWKVTFDNFQENYHLRFIHKRTNGAPPLDTTENPYNYPMGFELFGPHRMNTSPGGGVLNDPPKPLLLQLLGRMAAQFAEEGLTGGAHDRDYFIFFPNLYVFGNPSMHFTHAVLPLSAERSRGVFRFYWNGEPSGARAHLARELALAFAREIHTEDGDVLMKGQKGISSGAISQFHFQSQEVMCRHLYHSVDRMVREYIAEQGAAR